jgi:hypothetical protein
VMRTIEKEDRYQKQSGEPQQGKNHRWMLVPPVVDPHRCNHQQQATGCPTQLPEQKEIARPVPLFGHYCGRAENHYQSNENEEQRDREQPSIDTNPLGHGKLFISTRTCGFSPRKL